MTVGTGAGEERRRGSYARGRRRRAEIVRTARELFVSQGYRAVSLRELAAAAGLSHPGLLRHFPDKATILADVVAQLEEENAAWLLGQDPGAVRDPACLVALARHNAGIPGYVELFTALAGEATSADHPAHRRMRERYETLRQRNTDLLRPYVRDPGAEATRLAAGWDGLQLLSLYDGSVDVPMVLGRWIGVLTADSSGGVENHPPASAVRDAAEISPGVVRLPRVRLTPGDIGGASAVRRTRARIVAEATRLFARTGYHGTSLQDVAEAAGVSKSGLLHHTPTKEALLAAVLQQRDQDVLAAAAHGRGTAAADVRSLIDAAAAGIAAAPGLIEAYAVLSCEATAPEHPAHAYFRRRFTDTRAAFTDLFARLAAEGRMISGWSPQDAGTWLAALWDGLQVQWLYDPAVDVPALLAGDLDRVAPGTPG